MRVNKILSKLALVAFFFCISTKAISQTSPVYNWLVQNIQQNDSLYTNKNFSNLLDSLTKYGIKDSIKQYRRNIVSDGQSYLTKANDTIFTNNFILFFGEVFGTGSIAEAHRLARPNNINTHIPKIYLEFTQPIPFPAAYNLPPNDVWGWRQVEDLCRPFIIKKIVVGEY